ncbi:MAG: type II toxin-antitoxin system Phd/YefM family antitoxin [Nitrospirota bacterium]
MRTWQLQEAKARLSEVIRQASKEGPQTITMRGEPAAVIISKDEYERLKRPRERFVDFMRKSPLYGADIDLRREQTLTREADIS